MSFEPAPRPRPERARDLPRPSLTHWTEIDWQFYGTIEKTQVVSCGGSDRGGEKGKSMAVWGVRRVRLLMANSKREETGRSDEED